MSQRKIKKLKKQIVTDDGVVETRPTRELSVINILKNNWKFVVGLCIGIFLLYLNALNGDFVSDDYATIPQNPLIGSLNNAIKGSFPSLSNYFVYKLFGFGSSFPYHLFSVCLYLIVLVLVFVFLYLVTNSLLLSQLTTVLFALNPVHVEAVSWISGKPYLLSPITVMITLIIMIKLLQTGNRKLLLPFLISIAVCFYSEKVRFFSFVFIGLTYILSYSWQGKNKINWLSVILWSLLGIVVVAILIYPAVMVRINAVNSGTNASGSLFYDPFFQYPTSMTKYLQLVWFPIDLTLYHTMFVFPNWLNWCVLITYLTMVVYFYFKNKQYFFALVFIFAAAAPSMAPIKVSWLVAERYMFLGSLGMAMLVALIILDMSRYLRLIPVTIFLSLCVVMTIRTWTRNIDWQTNHNLWVNTCQVSPNSHNAWNNIGDDYDKLKDYPNAVKGFTQSTIVKPNYADAYHNRANIFFKIGRLDLARESYQTAVRMNPGLYQTYLSLTQVDLMDKQYESALADANQAIRFDPSNPQSWYVLGVVQAQIGKVTEARLTMEKVLQMAPGYKPASDALIQLKSST